MAKKGWVPLLSCTYVNVQYSTLYSKCATWDRHVSMYKSIMCQCVPFGTLAHSHQKATKRQPEAMEGAEIWALVDETAVEPMDRSQNCVLLYTLYSTLHFSSCTHAIASEISRTEKLLIWRHSTAAAEGMLRSGTRACRRTLAHSSSVRGDLSTRTRSLYSVYSCETKLCRTRIWRLRLRALHAVV